MRSQKKFELWSPYMLLQAVWLLGCQAVGALELVEAANKVTDPYNTLSRLPISHNDALSMWIKMFYKKRYATVVKRPPMGVSADDPKPGL